MKKIELTDYKKEMARRAVNVFLVNISDILDDVGKDSREAAEAALMLISGYFAGRTGTSAAKFIQELDEAPLTMN